MILGNCCDKADELSRYMAQCLCSAQLRGGTSLGILPEEWQVLEGLEMSSIVTSLCHPPSRDTKPSTLPNHPLMKRFALVPPTLQEMKLRTTVHAPFSVWFIIEIYGEAKKSWLLRNNHSLEQICVIKQHVGINSTHRHCSDNNAVPFSK